MINFKIYAVVSVSLILGITLNSCFIGSIPFESVSNDNSARKMRDFDGYYPKGLYKLDFKIGDRFMLNQPMYFYLANTGILQLHPTSRFSGPPLNKYLSDPDQFKFGGRNNCQIIRLVPRGEVIRLVAIKHSSQAGYLPYFVFEGKDQWFRSSTFAVSGGKGDHSDTYDREYFSKLAAQ